MLNRYFERLLSVAILLVVVISSVCWGKILYGSYGPEQVMVEKTVTEEVQTIRQIRSNATMLSGAIVVLSRFVSIAASEEE